MRRFTLILSLLLLGLMSAESTRAAEQMVQINHAVSFLEDQSGEMSIKTIRAADVAGDFQPHQSNDPLNFGLSSSVYWLRFDLAGQKSDGQMYLLEVAYYALTDVTLFYPDGRKITTGQYEPVADRPWPHRHLVFPVRLSSDQPQTYYLRVASAGSITVPLRLWTPEAFSLEAQTNYLWVAGYYGSAAALLLYNFFLFLSLRDRNYLFYCGFLLFTAFGMFIMNGFGAYALTPFGWPKSVGTNSFFALSGLFALWFLREFLGTARELPRTDKLLQFVMGLFIVIAALPVLDIPVRFGVGSLSTLGVIAGPLMLAVTVVSWLRGHHGARFLMLAWTVLLIAVSVQAARNFNLLPTNVVTSNLLQIGSMLDMLLLSFALADRIQGERLARERAQKQAMEAQNKLVEGLQESERQLEQRVKQRTQALELALKREHETLNEYVEFGALIAHEFRNPLAIISNQAQLAQLEQKNAQKPSGHRLEIIERATERLQALFDQWLKSDRLKDRIDALERETVDLTVWLPQILKKGDLRVNHDIVLDIQPAKVFADKALLSSAIHNLVDNAAKYSPEDKPVTVKTLLEPDRIGIAIIDHGVGIAESEQALIFKKHHRATRNQSSRGLGLGLYFVAEVIHAHGGEVTLESQPGQGSRFTLWLPRQTNRALP